MSRHIVVDTSVARASGKGNMSGGHPAPACIKCLDAIMICAVSGKGGMYVAMSRSLKEEWRNNGCEYALRWLSSLLARKRVTINNDVWSKQKELEAAAEELPGKGLQAVMKDAHIVGLAMLTGQCVVALDERQRDLLAKLLVAVPDLCGLHWANPAKDGSVPEWLRQGAPSDSQRCIGQ